MLMNIFRTLPRTSAIYLNRPLNHNLKTFITIKFTFLFFYFLCFGFDHGVALSIRLHAFLTVPCACEFITNGGSFWTVITYPIGPVNTWGISYFVTPEREPVKMCPACMR